MDEQDFRKAKEFESKIFGAQQAMSDARMALAFAESEYKLFTAKLIDAKMHNIELTTTGPCRKPLMHCVYDLRDTHWPRCIFCGSPKYGD